MVKIDKDEIVLDGAVFDRHAVREQMDRVLESRHFRNSRRYPVLLRFAVEQTLAGKLDGLKERTLGVEVFGRLSDYDTNADPIVRVTAGEVRKRLAQYYQEEGHEREIRIDLPLGAYVPHFVRPEPAPVAEAASEGAADRVEGALVVPIPAHEEQVPAPVLPARPQQVRRQWWRPAWVWGLAAVLASVGAFAAFFWLHQQRTGRAIRYFWNPVLASADPVTVVIGVHSLDESGQEKELTRGQANAPASPPEDMLDTMVRSEMVPVSDVVSYSRVTDLLTRSNRRYSTVGSSDATIENIRSGPLVLVGGLDNVWTLRLTAKLRFHFEQKLQTKNGILDTEHPGKVWRFNNMQDAAATTQDFALVASYFDTTIDQPVIVVAGIGKTGTEIASEFVTSEEWLHGWFAKAAPGRTGRNVEIVLSTEIVDGKAGPPHVLASSVW